jgi:uncharacterized protein (TIGR02597 family)
LGKMRLGASGEGGGIWLYKGGAGVSVLIALLQSNYHPRLPFRMKTTPSSRHGFGAALVALLGLGFGLQVSAETVKTAPVGVMSVVIAPAPVSGTKITTFSPSLRLPISESFVGKSAGKVTSLTSTTLSDATAAWAAGALSQAATPYYIKLTSGAAAGAMWQVSTTAANTASSVTILNLSGRDPLTAGALVGDAYEIIPADTLSTLFAGLESQIGGLNIDAADNVKLHDGASWRTFYYNSSAGVQQWREGSSSFNRNNIIVRPNSGVIYTRRGQTPITLMVMGLVVIGSEKFVVQSTGASFIGGVYPVDRQLASLNLQSMPGFVVNSGDLNAADKVKFYDGSSWRLLSYNGSQWREGASNFNRNTLMVPAGTPVIIERGVGAAGNAVLATVPAPYTL